MINSTIELDLIHTDDLSVFSFGEDDIEVSVGVAGLSVPVDIVKTFESVPFSLESAYAAPVSDEDDDDESNAEDSLFTDVSFHQHYKQEPSAIDGHRPSTFEEMITKLNRSMLRSARTRALVSKTVVPDLRKKGLGAVKKSCFIAEGVHRAHQPPAKNWFYEISQRGACRLTLDDQNHSSIGGFLRASKRW